MRKEQEQIKPLVDHPNTVKLRRKRIKTARYGPPGSAVYSGGGSVVVLNHRIEV